MPIGKGQLYNTIQYNTYCIDNSSKYLEELNRKIENYQNKILLFESSLNNFFNILKQEASPSAEKLNEELKKIATSYNELKNDLDVIGGMRDRYRLYAEQTRIAIDSFLKLIGRYAENDELEKNLNDIAVEYIKMKDSVERSQIENTKKNQLKADARKSIEKKDFSSAAIILRKAELIDLKQYVEEIAKEKHLIASVETKIERARLEREQLHYNESAHLFQQAAMILPESRKKERATYLYSAGVDFQRVNRDADALRAFEQGLKIQKEIGDLTGEAETCWYMGAILKESGEQEKAGQYIKRAKKLAKKTGYNSKELGKELKIIKWQLIGENLKEFPSYFFVDKKQKFEIINNDKKITDNVLNSKENSRQFIDDIKPYLEVASIRRVEAFKQSVELFDFFDHKDERAFYLYMAGLELLNVSKLDEALSLFKQSEMVARNIENKEIELESCWNIGLIHYRQREFSKAKEYVSRAIQLREEAGLPVVEKYANTLNLIKLQLNGSSLFRRIISQIKEKSETALLPVKNSEQSFWNGIGAYFKNIKKSNNSDAAA